MQFAPGRLRYGRESPANGRNCAPSAAICVFTMLVIPEATQWLSGTHCAAGGMGPGSAAHHCVLRRARDDKSGLPRAAPRPG